jgi:ATP-dependent Clp endopeptidase proteolytic subunit ClpP
VPAVTELIVAELLYMQYTDGKKPVYLYINSTGCTRADGETVGFETEATAIYDTMNYIANPVYTVGIGVAIGQACMLLSAGEKGHRYMMPHATAMLHQPRVPSTGQRQAIELYIKWREVLAQKQSSLDILHLTTGQPHAKLDRDTARPLYMQPADALEYGVIDKVMKETVKGAKGGNADSIVDAVKGADAWDKDAGLVAKPSPRSAAM